MATYLLDTNTIEGILQKSKPEHIRFKQRLQDALSANAVVLMSPIVFYEIARLLYKKGARKQLHAFERLRGFFTWCHFNQVTWERGAKLWARCRKLGRPTGEGLDCDVLIAAQAQEHNATVITNNVRHFDYLGVNHESW
jgi:predicted nucleic acid-binding protein